MSRSYLQLNLIKKFLSKKNCRRGIADDLSKKYEQTMKTNGKRFTLVVLQEFPTRLSGRWDKKIIFYEVLGKRMGAKRKIQTQQ